MEFLKYSRQRPEKNPLPSWGLSLKVLITTLQKTLNNFKDNIHLAQLITKAAVPIPLHVQIIKVDIPRRRDLGKLLKGLDPALNSGELDAEYVVYAKQNQSCMNPQDSLESSKIILFAHGGAFCVCTPKTHRGMAWRLSKYSNAKILSIKYRLAPQYKFPAALHDMLSAYFYLIDPPENQIKYHPSQVIFAGDSAGGNLSLTAAYWLASNSCPLPGGIVGLSPWLDLSHSLPSVRINDVYDYLPDQSKDPRYINDDRFHYLLPDNDQLHDPLVSPLFGNNSQLKSLPPTLLQVGDAEKLRDESILFSLLSWNQGNKNVQVELYQDMVHVFHMFCPMDVLPKLALKRAGEFICSLKTPQDSQEQESLELNNYPVKWIRKDKSVLNLQSPIDILEDGYERLKNDSSWGEQQKNTYHLLLSKLSKNG